MTVQLALCVHCALPVFVHEWVRCCIECGQYSHPACGPVHKYPSTHEPWMGIIKRRGDHP